MLFFSLLTILFSLNADLFLLKNEENYKIAAFDNALTNEETIKENIRKKTNIYEQKYFKNSKQEFEEKTELLNIFFTQAKYDYGVTEKQAKKYAQAKTLCYYEKSFYDSQIESIFNTDVVFDYHIKDENFIQKYVEEKNIFYQTGLKIYKDKIKAIFYADSCMTKKQGIKITEDFENKNNIFWSIIEKIIEKRGNIFKTLEVSINALNGYIIYKNNNKKKTIPKSTNSPSVSKILLDVSFGLLNVITDVFEIFHFDTEELLFLAGVFGVSQLLITQPVLLPSLLLL